MSISEYLERNFKTIKEKEKAARTVLDFILYFAPFRDIIPLREIIYQTLLESLNRAKNLEELHDLLLVDILLRIIEIYIINSPLSDKKTIISNVNDRPYNGHLRVYIVEPVSRWNNHDEKQYNFGRRQKYSFLGEILKRKGCRPCCEICKKYFENISKHSFLFNR